MLIISHLLHSDASYSGKCKLCLLIMNTICNACLTDGHRVCECVNGPLQTCLKRDLFPVLPLRAQLFPSGSAWVLNNPGSAHERSVLQSFSSALCPHLEGEATGVDPRIKESNIDAVPLWLYHPSLHLVLLSGVNCFNHCRNFAIPNCQILPVSSIYGYQWATCKIFFARIE